MKSSALGTLAPLAAAAFVALVASPAAAAEGGEKEFGNPGVIAVDAVTSLNFSYTSTSRPNGAPSTSLVGFGIEPQAHYFVIEGLSVGGNVHFNYSKPKDGDGITNIGLGPIVGYNLWVSPGLLSLWPQAGIFYDSSSISLTSTGANGTTSSTSVTQSKFSIGIFAPLLIHPVKHFHFGIGPFFKLDLSSSVSGSGQSADGDKDLSVGIKGEIGGWL